MQSRRITRMKPKSIIFLEIYNSCDINYYPIDNHTRHCRWYSNPYKQEDYQIIWSIIMRNNSYGNRLKWFSIARGEVK